MRLTLIAGVLVVGISGLALWRAMTLVERQLGVLTGPVDRIAAHWEADKVPFSKRIIRLIISDARSAADPAALSPQPPWSEQIAGWVRSRTIGGRASVDSSALVIPFLSDPDAVVWTHDGFSTVTPEQMVNEIKMAVLKANAAEAEVDIVAQGASAGAVVRALKDLDGQTLKGEKVGANKVFLVGMNEARLKLTPWASGEDLARPGNVLELAEIYAVNKVPRTTRLELFVPHQAAQAYAMERLWPEVAEASPQAFGLWIQGLLTRTQSLAQLASSQEAAAQEAEARQAALEVAARQADIQKMAQAAAARQAQTQRLLDEVAQKKAAMWKAVEAPSNQATADQLRPQFGDYKYDWAQHDKQWGRCCADLGGSWQRGSYDDNAYRNCWDASSCRAVCGCCDGANYRYSVQSCHDAPSGCRDRFIRGEFQCAGR
jgi:hypothetical protein